MALRPSKKGAWFSSLPEVAAKMVAGVDAAMVEGANRVKDEADRRLEPHRLTGELERQTHVDAKQREGVYVMAGDPSEGEFAFWGAFLEFGQGHGPPYPFLVPALEQEQEGIVGMVAAAVRRAV
jgi:hypothetical protein